MTDAHAQARAYTQARLDDRLAPEQARWLAAHLAGCDLCRAYAAELDHLAQALPETFRARWDMDAERPAYRPTGGPTVTTRQKVFNFAGIGLGLGALAILLAGFAFALQTATTTDSQIPGQAQAATPPALFTPPPMQYAVNVRFGGAIALEGYSFFPFEGGVTVELLWRALAAPPGDYAVGVFAMPDGAQSAILAQSDSVPARGTRPTTGWQTGEYVIDSHDLPMVIETDLANLVLWVNVYDPNTGERLPSDPPGGGPFNATPIGSFSLPLAVPLTATPLPFPSGPAPDACAGGPCTPTPTPCLEGCLLDPSAQATAEMAATFGWTATPVGFVPSVTPCQAGCPESFTLTVRQGDTLQGIAAFYGVTEAEIIALNGLTEPVTLSVGQVLTIPVQRGQDIVPLDVTPTPAP